MKLKYLLILLILGLSLRASAQPPETVYLGTVIQEGYANDASYGPFNIGFNFTFFGNSYSQFYVSSNGLVTFGAGLTDASPNPIPSAGPTNFIAPFWDDLTISFTGKVLYTTIGAAPNRKLIIQFVNMNFYNPAALFGSFSVILYETTNVIQTQYRIIVDNISPRPHGGTATIGIENSTGTSGVQYSNLNASAITNEQAISYTPSDPTYTVNSNAVYDGIYLTTNISLPEPGITTLISPAQNAVIGANQTFEWAAASNAASYTLYLSPGATLSSATAYFLGSNLTYDISGLTLGSTFSWAVFATNTTGTTWCEIKQFTTSSNPPLAAVPQTIYVEQNQEKTINLNTGGDGSSKSAIITVLPVQGQLYQYNAGVKGALISTVPTTVTDAGRNVIYFANGTSGNAVGNFTYKMNDNTGDSPPAVITVNVSPPGIPSLLYVSKSTAIELQFDRPMADPSGKQGDFTATVNSSSVAISSLSLKPGDNYSIIATLSSPLAGGETVLISYTAGTVASAQGGWLASFTNQAVTLSSQTIIFNQTLTKKFSDSPLTFTASAPGGSMTYSSSNLAVATFSGIVATFLSVGSTDITARQAGNGTYAPAKYTRTMTVAKGDQTITFGVLAAKTFGDSDFTLSAVAGSSLLVGYVSDNLAVATVTGNTVHIVGAGTAVITASQSGNTNWNAATSVPQTLTVTKATATITLGSLSPTYNGLSHAASATTTPAGLTVGLTYDGSATIPVNAGSYAVVATINDINYQGTASGTLVISKATLTANADDKTKVYGAANPALTISYSGFVNSENASVLDATLPVVATTADATTAVGTVTITVSGGVDNNYIYNDVNGTLTITKAPLTATAEDKTRVYGDPNPTLTVSYSGFVNSENATVIDTEPAAATTAGATTSAGTVPITVSGGSDNNYSFSYVSGTLTITKATATVILGSLLSTYNGLSHAATATTTPAGLTVGFTYDGSATIPVNAGSYAVIATINDINYLGTVSGTLVISKATLTATADDKTKVYGAANPALTISYSGFVNSENASVLDATLPVAATTVDATTAVGSVAITVSGGVDNNYIYNDVNGTLTITKAILTATADDKTRVYGDPNPALTVSYSGFVNSENASVIDIVPSASTTAGATTSAGTVPITVSGGSDNNYSFNYVSGTLTITKATAIVTLGSLSPTYTGLSHAATATTTPAGLTVDFTYDGSATLPVNAGSYAVVATINDINYQGTSSGILVISNATLTFTSENKTRSYQTSNPTLTYTISGFVNGETKTVLDVSPTIQTTAVLNSPTGNYPITLSGGNDNNYTFIYIAGTLTITKLQQTITITAVPEKLLVGDSYSMAATSSSGLAVLFESKDATLATVSGVNLTGVSKGFVQIRGYNAGDQNYDPAEVFTTVEIYSTHKDIMHLYTPNNDGINDYWELPELATWGKCDVKVYNRLGTLVFADPDYNNLWDGRSNGNPVPEGAYYYIIKTENAGVVKGTVNVVR